MSPVTLFPLPAPEAVIPHRGDVLLIDRIVALEARRLQAALTVRRGTAFSDERGALPAWAAPEIMAQAVAAFGSCRALIELGHTAPLGLLLGVRQLDLRVEAFQPGDEVRVDVLCTSADEEGRGVFDCELHVGGELAAAATLTAFQPRESEDLRSLLAAE